MSIRPSSWNKQIGSRWMNFREILHWVGFTKILRENTLSVKSKKKITGILHVDSNR